MPGCRSPAKGSNIVTDAVHPEVGALLQNCPFLLRHLELDHLDLATIAFGAAARAVIAQRLSLDEEDAVFAYFNALAEQRRADEILGTGAIELFNDSAAAQSLARRKLSGHALSMLEDFRVSWGQPDYGGGS